MTDAITVPAKYIFLDVVDFTHNRSVEAQSDIVRVLNEIVRTTVSDNSIPDENRIFLPTGDGICIALLNVECLPNIEPPYDLHLRTGLAILNRLEQHNATTKDDQRRFEIRVGINENIDNLIVDVNGARNVAGDGINLSQRIMSLADGNQILVSDSVVTTLRVREKYMNSSFKAYPPTKIKHGMMLTVHQFIAINCSGLNTDTPHRFKVAETVEPRLTQFAAYYFAHALANEGFFVSRLNSSLSQYPGVLLLQLLAKDSVEKLKATAIDGFEPDAPDFGTNLEEQYKYFESLKFWVKSKLYSCLVERNLSTWPGKFKRDKYGSINYLFVNSSGKEKLKNDWPQIWQEFDLDSAAEQMPEGDHQ